jgi:hypothetical protein
MSLKDDYLTGRELGTNSVFPQRFDFMRWARAQVHRETEAKRGTRLHRRNGKRIVQKLRPRPAFPRPSPSATMNGRFAVVLTGEIVIDASYGAGTRLA